MLENSRHKNNKRKVDEEFKYFHYNGNMFNPTEIIFAATTLCNLHCPHCFVNRLNIKLKVDQAVAFLRSAVPSIERVGFSGGEPFLYMEFMTEVIKEAVKLDLMFDQIITNGDWWKNQEDLREKLQTLYDAGYDGKIGLSWDVFHAQSRERVRVFINIVKEIFGPDAINIQTVVPYDQDCYENKKLQAEIQEGLKELEDEVDLFYIPQSFPCTDMRSWKSRKWFKEDYCEGPGQILFVHPTGDIAPCCGFANENKALFIGNIKDDFDTVMKKAQENPMIKICYEEGLSHYRRHGLKKMLHSQGKKLPGKCSDICSFCDYVCKIL